MKYTMNMFEVSTLAKDLLQYAKDIDPYGVRGEAISEITPELVTEFVNEDLQGDLTPIIECLEEDIECSNDDAHKKRAHDLRNRVAIYSFSRKEEKSLMKA